MRYQPRCSTLPEADAPGLAFGVALTFLVLGYLGLLMACIGPALGLPHDHRRGLPDDRRAAATGRGNRSDRKPACRGTGEEAESEVLSLISEGHKPSSPPTASLRRWHFYSEVQHGKRMHWRSMSFFAFLMLLLGMFWPLQ